MKKVITASVILVLVPTIIFIPIYALMIHTAKTNIKDYTNEVIGTWDAFQYYYGADRIVCDENHNMTITISDDLIHISGNILSVVKTSYEWKSGTAINYVQNGTKQILYFSFDTRGNLQINTEGSEYIILLRKVEG